MPVKQQQGYYTPQEYLDLEAVAEQKSEYRDGEIIPLAGGTTNHNKIAGNFYANFRFAFRQQDYEIYMGDVRLGVSRYRRYTYPDVMIVQGEPIYEGQRTDIVTNPLIIVEVLSKSTGSYDRGDKFLVYRSLPSLQEYILIDQYKFYVEQFNKNTQGQWTLTEHEDEDQVLKLAAVDFQISFAEIYERVNFSVKKEDDGVNS
ncbi:MAG: Uma2 family endonuclease [Spirulinaceae cyanobacterium]